MRETQNKLSTSEAERLQGHIIRLCEQHGIDLRIIPGCQVFAYPTLHRIHIVPIQWIEDYCIALHEIGHVVLNHRPEQSRPWKEILAWRWAKVHCGSWNSEMEIHKDWCLQCWGIPGNANPVNYLLDHAHEKHIRIS